MTVPDNTVIAPGAAFIKTWRVRNDGNCAWGPGQTVRTLTFTKGVQMGAPAQVSLARNVAPGSTVDVSVNLTAPGSPGTYRSEWKFLNTDGQLIGVGVNRLTPLYAQIVVPSQQGGPGQTKTYVSKAYHYIDALTNAPPMQGYENCEKNFVFHNLPACLISLPGGQYPPAKLWVLQREKAYFSIYMSYQGAEPVQLFTDLVSSFRFLADQ